MVRQGTRLFSSRVKVDLAGHFELSPEGRKSKWASANLLRQDLVWLVKGTRRRSARPGESVQEREISQSHISSR